MKFVRLVSLAFPLLLQAQQSNRPLLLDACEDTTGWRTFQSVGVIVTQHRDVGVDGDAIRFDVAFTKGAGYGGVVRNFDIPLPENYAISFSLRATVPVNNFEVKMSNDSAGENIWWVNTRNFVYPTKWKRIHVKKRHLSFAWGPHPSASLDTLRRLELVVTAGTGGNGSVWIDDIQLQPIAAPPSVMPMPIVTASSSSGKAGAPTNVLPGVKGGWTSNTSGKEWLEVNFRYPREIGGVRLRWDDALKELSYDVLGSLDGKRFDTLHSVRNGKGGPVLVFTPEADVQYLRLALLGSQPRIRYRLDELSVVPSESLSTSNQYIEHLAADAPRGAYPRYFLKEQPYWTIVGVASDEKEALFNEDGAFEVDKQRFSIEPFIRLERGGELLTWANGTEEQSLENGYLPIPTVRRTANGLSLSVTLIASGEPSHSVLMARYVVKNVAQQVERGALYLAVRPFQVNPTSQWLNFEGGFARTDSIAIWKNRTVIGDKSVTVSGQPAMSGAAGIDGGEIVEHIAAGILPSETRVHDPLGMASAAFEYRFELKPDDSLVVVAGVPFYPMADRWTIETPTATEFDQALSEARTSWEKKLNTVQFNLPAEARHYADILRSNLAYVLINKDGPGFQPGSRSYERSWIRDGSLTSAALLKLGLGDDVRRFVEWYSSYQFENGMVPCVVDKRGPDPVPENDSHGELIFACMEYFRFTGDTTFLRARWHNIVGAVDYMQQLRAQCMTPEYRDGSDEKRAFYGLMTASISHEGYSAMPMHSYWDDFFALKGFKDAAAAAAVLGEQEAARRYDSIAHAFRDDLYRSITLAMKNKNIDYVPGCAELGDFDPTSTSIALFPCEETKEAPQPALGNTFEKYYGWFMQRAKNEIPWETYTPYEIRNVGSFVYLGQKERAHQLLEWFAQYQRPEGWNDWAEVVCRDRRRARFIGDMPHTWVGSDYINALRAMFAYELDDDRALVVGGGLKDDWVLQGLSVENLPTHFGTLSYSVNPMSPASIAVRLKGSLDRAVILIPVSLLNRPIRSAAVEGRLVQPVNGFVKVSRLPATVEMNY